MCCFCLFILFVFFSPYKNVRGTQNTETPGSNTLARFDPRPAGVLVFLWEGGGATVSHTQEYFRPLSLLETSESDCCAGIGCFFFLNGEGLVSLSGCRPEGTHSRRPDRRGPQRTHALG